MHSVLFDSRLICKNHFSSSREENGRHILTISRLSLLKNPFTKQLLYFTINNCSLFRIKSNWRLRILLEGVLSELNIQCSAMSDVMSIQTERK